MIAELFSAYGLTATGIAPGSTATPLIGIEGVKSIEMNRKPKKFGKKTMKDSTTNEFTNAKKAH